MFRPDKTIFWFGLISAYALISTEKIVFAHSGHKHEEKLRISLPNVVAKVNGEDIRSDNITRELKQTLTNYKERGIPLSAEEEKIATKKLIDDEISRALLLQRGKDIGANVTDEMLDRRLKQIKSAFKSDTLFEHELKNRKITVEQYKKGLKTDLQMKQVIDREIVPNIKIGEEDIKAYYEKNKDKFRGEKKARASVILIKTNRGDAGSEKAARKKIEGVLQQIKNGANFDKMATKHSQDSLASKGGDLGYFTKNQMFGAFSSRAFDMDIGEVSAIFKTGHGFHILKLIDLKEGEIVAVDKATRQIENILIKNKTGNAIRNYVKALKQKAEIKMYF